MAVTGGSWFSANTLVNHSVSATGLQAQNDAVRNDPKTLVSFYDTVPKDDIALPQFEEWGVARLRTLRGIEQIASLNKKPADSQSAISSLLDKHMKVAGSPATTKHLDVTSHFILRLAFCTSEDNRRWLISRECDLFKHRYNCLSGSERADCLKQWDLPYTLATEDELEEFRTQLSQVAYHTYLVKAPESGHSEPLSAQQLSEMGYRKVPFENVCRLIWYLHELLLLWTDVELRVPDLVGSRKVFLNAGFAYVPSELLCSVVTSLFRQQLARGLVITAGQWATSFEDQENNRLTPILKSLSKRQLLEEVTTQKVGDGVRVSLQDIPALAQRHFPLCMQHLYNTLMADRHLRHAGRQQFRLFLKKAGLSMEESMLFWKSSFAPRTPAEKFEKEYSYNIRHSYGKEGRRKDYEAQRCCQIIPATPVVGEANGCPFKTFDKDALTVSLGRIGLPNGKTSEVLRLAREGHFQVACDRMFEGVHGERPDKLIEHPNEYLAAAIDVQKKQEVAPSTTPPVAGGGRPSTATNVSSTPGPSSGLPVMRTPFTANSVQDPSFLRTPINITPSLGVLGKSSSGTPPLGTPGDLAPAVVAAKSEVLGGAPVGSPIAGIVTTANNAK